MTRVFATVVLLLLLGTGAGRAVTTPGSIAGAGRLILQEPSQDQGQGDDRGTSSTADTVLRRRVEAALASATDVDGDRIQVVARKGVVTVSGHVSSGTEQQSVGAIVRAVPGVTEVRFSLVVAPSG